MLMHTTLRSQTPASIADKRQSMVVPYPVANSTPVPWGLCRYVTSSNIQKVPCGGELSSMCARLMDVLQNTRYKHTSVLFELFSSRQYMNAKGLDEMAYAGRSADIQCLCMVQWESDDHTSAKTKDELNEAREVAQSIIRLGKPGEGPVYGNYRAYDLVYRWTAIDGSTNLLPSAQSLTSKVTIWLKASLVTSTTSCRTSKPSTTRTSCSTSGSRSLLLL
jgi:hypothetical protein